MAQHKVQWRVVVDWHNTRYSGELLLWRVVVDGTTQWRRYSGEWLLMAQHKVQWRVVVDGTTQGTVESCC